MEEDKGREIPSSDRKLSLYSYNSEINEYNSFYPIYVHYNMFNKYVRMYACILWLIHTPG